MAGIVRTMSLLPAAGVPHNGGVSRRVVFVVYPRHHRARPGRAARGVRRVRRLRRSSWPRPSPGRSRATRGPGHRRRPVVRVGAGRDRHARRRRRRGRDRRRRVIPKLVRAVSLARPPQPAGRVGVHRRVRARGGRTARRQARDDALVVVRPARRAATRRSTVEADRIFVRDGNVWTSAGVTAGMDLALALVADDMGQRRRAARSPASSSCTCSDRAGRRSSARSSSAQRAARDPLRELQAWIGEHPGRRPHGRAARGAGRDEPAPLRARVPAPRSAARPRCTSSRSRVEVARRLLETTALIDRRGRARPPASAPPRPCAARSPGGSARSPTDYRDRFRSFQPA